MDTLQTNEQVEQCAQRTASRQTRLENMRSITEALKSKCSDYGTALE